MMMIGTHQGYDYVVWVNEMGYRCGYVRVPEDHPCWGKSYDQIDVDVHGCLTFGEHVKKADDRFPVSGYWVGFDCGHYVDEPDPDEMSLELLKMHRLMKKEMKIFLESLGLEDVEGKIRNERYVESQCRNLIGQLKEIGVVNSGKKE